MIQFSVSLSDTDTILTGKEWYLMVLIPLMANAFEHPSMLFALFKVFFMSLAIP